METEAEHAQNISEKSNNETFLRAISGTDDTGGRFKDKTRGNILRTLAQENDKDGHGMNQTCSTRIVQTLKVLLAPCILQS